MVKRFIIFYPATAAMSLFLNMVIHPLDDDVHLDLERLVSSANVIRSIPTQDLTDEEIRLVRDVRDFIMGLVWLGTSAITKANSEERGEHSH